MGISIKMDVQTYNAIYEIVNSLTGKAAIAATSLQESIQKEANANVVEVPATETTEARKDLPKSITIDVKESVLNGIYGGLTAKIDEPTITTTELKKFVAVATVLKMKGRIESYLEEISKKLPEDGDFDVDVPFDQE